MQAGQSAHFRVLTPIWLKQEAANLGIDEETLRRRIVRDPLWEKRGGKWCRDA